MSARSRAQEAADFLDQPFVPRGMVIQDKDVHFDRYLNQDEIAKLRDASTYREQVRAEILNPTVGRGAELPWAKVKDFRLRPEELTIWTGYNGHKKSMLLGYVFLGLMAQELPCCIASLEMPPRKTLLRMCKQWIGVTDPSMQYVERFFNWAQGKLWMYDQVGTVRASKIVAVVRYAAQELGVRHFVIDSLMKCGVSVEDLDAQKRFVDELTAAAKDTSCHIHLVAHARKPEGAKETIPSSKYGVKGASEITDMADNVVVVFCDKEDGKKKGKKDEPSEDEGDKDGVMMIVDKQRHGEAEPRYRFQFEPGSLQFKPSASASKMEPDEWERCAWR